MPRKKAEAVKEKPKKKAVRKKAEKKAEKKVVTPMETSLVDGLLDCVVQNPKLVSQFNQLGFKSRNPEGMTYREAIVCGQIANAVKGNTRAYIAVMESVNKEERMPLEEFVLGNGHYPMEDLVGGR